MIKGVRLEFPMETTLGDDIRDAIEFAKKNDMAVSFEFNGIELHVSPDSTLEEQLDEYARLEKEKRSHDNNNILTPRQRIDLIKKRFIDMFGIYPDDIRIWAEGTEESQVRAIATQHLWHLKAVMSIEESRAESEDPSVTLKDNYSGEVIVTFVKDGLRYTIIAIGKG